MNKSKLSALLAVILVCSACASSKLTPSGFLGDSRVYTAMQPDLELEDVKVYKTTPYPLAGYDSFIVPPVSIYLNEEGKARGVSEDDLVELAEEFRKTIIKELGSRYQVTNAPAPRVAILRLAITDADPNLALLNLHPGSLIMGGGLGGASVEADLIDSSSGKRVAAFMASSKGKRYEYTSGLTKWGHTEAVLGDWAKTLGERIRKAHG